MDYFGLDATPGPFTHDNAADGPYNAPRAVPVTPQSPGDITAPVEIGDSNKPPAEQTMMHEGGRGQLRKESDHRRMESVEGRAELP